MSKFDELREANKEDRVEFCAYRDECHRFGSQFVKGFSEYVECPKDALTLFPLQDADFDKRYNLTGASAFDDDGFFNFRIFIRLTPEGHHPIDSLAIKVFLRIIDNFYHIKFGKDDIELKIKADNPPELTGLYEIIFQRSKEVLRNRFNWWLRQEDSKKPIGFSTVTKDEKEA